MTFLRFLCAKVVDAGAITEDLDDFSILLAGPGVTSFIFLNPLFFVEFLALD